MGGNFLHFEEVIEKQNKTQIKSKCFSDMETTKKNVHLNFFPNIKISTWKHLVLSLEPVFSISKQHENLENKILKNQSFMEGIIF